MGPHPYRGRRESGLCLEAAKQCSSIRQVSRLEDHPTCHAFPSGGKKPDSGISWRSSPFTVAGQRRIFTGLPFSSLRNLTEENARPTLAQAVSCVIKYRYFFLSRDYFPTGR